MGHVKLHIPGPVEVSPKTFRAFSTPMIGHRSQAFKDLYAKIQPRLQSLFYTRQLVFISTSSAWGVMEAAIRNLVAKKVLCCMCGAFSDKWLDVARRCGKQADALQVDRGDLDTGLVRIERALDQFLGLGRDLLAPLLEHEVELAAADDLADARVGDAREHAEWAELVL